MLKLPSDVGKSGIRKFCTDIRDRIVNSAELSARLWTHLYSIDEYKLCENLLVYATIGSEPDTAPLIERAFDDGKKVYCPVINEQDMDFYRIDSLSELKPTGRYEIPEPTGDMDRVFRQNGENRGTIMITPALCVDKRGYRIGYGGGYYDRYLSKNSVECDKIFPICVIYSALCTDYFPNEPTDVAVKMIITENEIRRIGG